MSRWRGEPRWVRSAVAVLVLLLFYGTVVHVVQLLAAAGHPYPGLPVWLRLYFVCLTGLDPCAAVLLLLRRRAGVVLAVVVLASDAAANALANYAYDDAGGVTAGRVGQAVITVVALSAAMVAPTLWRATAGRRQAR